MRRFYALGVLVATAVAAALGLKVTEARADPEFNPCPVDKCPEGEKVELHGCETDTCGEFEDYSHLYCGICVPV